MADIIFGVMFLVGALSGYKRGVVRDVQYIVGTVIGLLAVPLFSPVIISLIERPTYRFLGSDVAGIIAPFLPVIFKTVIFVLVLRVCQKIVSLAFNISYLPQGVQKIDHIAGIVWGILKVALVVWAIAMFVGYTNGYIVTRRINAVLNTSVIYNTLKNINLLSKIFLL